MGVWKEAFNRIRFLGRRGFEDELDQEIRFHLETRADELELAGMARRAAETQARREFGSTARVGEDTRAAWQIRWIEDLGRDLVYAARAFRRNPAFVFAAVACLALGIGANTTIFSMATEALLSQPSVRDPATLMSFTISGNSNSPQEQYQFLRDQRIFSELAGEDDESMANWRHGEATERLFVVRVTGNYFQVTGIPVAIGRPITPDDRPSLVLSYRLWQRMGGDPNIPGQIMVLDGKPYNIAGVLPRDHHTLLGFGFAPDLYMTISNPREEIAMYARLPLGVSRAALNARLPALKPLFQAQWPDKRTGWSGMHAAAVSGVDRIRGEQELMPVVAFAAMVLLVVGLVLLIACANVASLLLARAASRWHEIAIRLSIGASRGRLVRQLLAEGFLLALCGTAAGVAVNVTITSLLSRYPRPLPFPIQLQIRPDWRLLIYAIGLAVVCTVASSLMPALRATRTRVASAPLRDRRQALVVAQLAVSVVLLCAGFIFVRNLVHASTMSPGFDTSHTVWASMRLVPQKYEHGNKTAVLIDSALDRLRALPGVESAAIAERVPLNEPMTTGTMMRTDLNAVPKRVEFNDNYVGPDYFKTMSIPMVRGREFETSDRKGAPRVAILNENMARRLFGDVDPVGHSIHFEGNGPAIRIAGVAKNSKYLTLGEENPLAYYEPYAQQSKARTDLRFLIRASVRPNLLVPAVNRVLRELDDTAALETKPMSQALGFAMLPSRVGAAILGSVGLLGLALAAIGLYGTLLYAVNRRIREIGLRMALGARPGQVLALVFRQSFTTVALGIAIGTALAVFAVRPLAMFLTPEVRPADPLNFVIVAGVLCGVALVATAAPAMRALRVDPMVALRHE